MAKEFLDPTGLAHAFTKIKTFVNTVVSNGIATKAPLHAVAEGITTAGDGAAYTATVEGITALTAGATFMMIPHTASTSKTATLNVNGLGAKTLRRRLSNSTVSTTAPSSTNWLGANKPVRVIYDGTYWIADFTRPNAADIYGTLPIANGGTGATTAAAALANIVTDGSIARANLANDALYSPMVYPTATPYAFTTSDIGKTFMTGSSLASSATDVVYTVNDDFGLNVPNGTEIAIIARRGINSTRIVFEGVQKSAVSGEQMTLEKTYEIPEDYGMIALKKINYGTSTAWWLVTGNVEVVS